MKTAEEICRSRVEPNDLPDYQVLVLDDAVKCAREFAAQEVEAYKERLKKAIHGYYLNSFREKEFCGIIDEIDTTK